MKVANKTATAIGSPRAKPKLLSGGNPQIAKADGDAPVRAYIEAMPGWKGDVGRLLDSLIVRNIPGVRKAVKWNTPFYGIEGQGWFLGFHCLTKFVRVGLFRGTSLRPMPPGESKIEGTRYLDIHENDKLDEAQMGEWLRQAAALPGFDPSQRRNTIPKGDTRNMKKIATKTAESPSELIDARIAELGDWRGEMLARIRALIKKADPEVVEEWKWRGTPVWSDHGIICTGETYKKVVKMTFAKGASLKDPAGLFNSSLEGNVRRAIDISEDDELNEAALNALIREAVELNKSSARR